ncbi:MULTISPECIES: hypothetical protein [unclassified Roseibium]|uniref:hypothetical protein n=1 Tax=unclassified Roseibium TaxID=2629323 RepID=UPI00273FB561|nr:MULTISPECIES: hypothetical protein [unclassified Roseibium]
MNIFRLFLALAAALVLAAPPASAQDEKYPANKFDPHAVDKYREFLHNNEKLAAAKYDEAVKLVQYLNEIRVPMYQWNHQVNILKFEGVFLNNPTCRSTGGGYGPVMRVTPGHQFPMQAIDVYFFGIFSGMINFSGGGVLESPQIGGNLFAGKIRGGESFCYANTTLGLWSHTTRSEYLIPQAGKPAIMGNAIFFVIADDFGKAPEGAHARFLELFDALLTL